MEMVNMETLAVIAILTALATEAFKTLFSRDVNSNVVAAVISVILSVALVIVIPVANGEAILGAALVIKGLEMAFFAVLCATLSYDKVIGAIKQVKA